MDFPAFDPVLIAIPGLPIDIRWYGVTYIIGFFVGQWILVRLARSGLLPVDPKVAPDIIFYCVIGVMLGGRTGYALFYDHGLLNPLEFLKVWKGGLAFHGGLAGVAVACWAFTRRHKIGWGRAADSCALAVTPGIFAVRCANFINGELYGRVTTADTFGAMQFPTDPMAKRALHLPDLEMRDTELCIQVAFKKLKFSDVREQLSPIDSHGQAIDWDRVAPHLDWDKVKAMTGPDGDPIVPFRHPSQIYEGVCEGLLLGLVMLVLYLATRKKPLSPGRYTVVFLLGYAIARSCLELVRQPDAQFEGDGTVLFGMTMGQTLSALLVIGAILIVFWPRRRS
ncbi:MAG: prolipoprotein diacylglyceryl transferase [Planctomycetes bacterium]|nr:prolipoprotein diacylglyceryl transferase [Planctomycetota bacterium]